MKTLAEFKRKIKKGVKLHTIYHQAPAGRDEAGNLLLKDEDKGVREVNIVQTNAFTLLTPKKDDPNIFVDSWLQYPKSNQVKFEESQVIIMDEDFRLPSNERATAPLIPLITYKFID